LKLVEIQLGFDIISLSLRISRIYLVKSLLILFFFCYLRSANSLVVVTRLKY